MFTWIKRFIFFIEAVRHHIRKTSRKDLVELHAERCGVVSPNRKKLVYVGRNYLQYKKFDKYAI